MATLEKIRSKSVLLLIIIAVALLAFILGDFLTSGRSFFGTGTTIAKVDGHKIDVQEFQRRLEDANRMSQQQGRKTDASTLQQQVLNEMIAETLFNEEMNRLGIKVTDAELTDLMVGANSQFVDQMARQQYGVESAATLHDMAFNPAKYQIDNETAAQLRAAWMQLEKSTEEQLRQQKFQTLFMGTLVANDLDAKALYDDNASTSHIAYTRKDFSSLDDSKYPVSDQEIETAWKERRNRYAIDEPSRLVDYISVEIAPSAADLQASQKKVEDALTALREKESTTGLEGMTEFVVERRNLTHNDLRAPGLKSFVDSATVGHAALINHVGNNYTLAKLLGVSTQTDSVNFDFMRVQGTRAQVDSIVNALNSGAKLADFADNELVEASQDSIWAQLTSNDAAQLRTMFENAVIGQYFAPDTIGEGSRIFRLRTRRAPVTVYDIAEVEYVAEPSAATVNTLQADLEKFIKENANSADFVKNAAAAGYNAQTALISASSPRLGMLDDSHAAVAWALDAKKGKVSDIFGDQSSERFIVAAVEDIYDGGYVTASNPMVRQELETRVRNNKKADELIKQYQGKAKDVAGYAAAMGTQVDSTTVSFGQMFIPKIGVNESALTAGVAAAKPGQTVGPFQANSGVIVFVVNSVDNQGRPFNAEESSVQFTQNRGAGALARNIYNILKGNKKVENRLPVFYK